MLWYKSWLETRSRFLIGLALLTILAAGNVFEYSQIQKLMPAAQTMTVPSGYVGEAIKEAIELSREYRGHIWLQWFRQNLPQMATLFAVLLASGGLLSTTSGGQLFTLSMPASRRRVLGVRAMTGLGEFMVLAFLPSLMIPLLSPLIGQHLGVGDVLVHGMSLFIGGSVFYSMALLLSTVFSDHWRPLLITGSVALVMAVCELVLPAFAPYGLIRVVSAERYFRGGGLQWLSLFGCAAVSAAMLYAAAINFERQDF